MYKMCNNMNQTKLKNDEQLCNLKGGGPVNCIYSLAGK